MLNRRILRIKAFKVLFSYAENQTMTLAEAESQLGESLEAVRTLYLFMLDVIPAVTAEAAKRIEEAKGKFNPTEEDLHPNMKFAQNSVAPLLSQDPDFQKIIKRRNLSWDQYDAFVRNLYDSIRKKDYFATYMASQERSVKEDAELFKHICEDEFVDNEEMDKILEDISVWWVDDLAYSLSCCCDTMNDFARGKRWNLPPLYRSEMNPRKQLDSDKDFVFKLLRTAYSNYSKYFSLVSENVPEWDESRLFTTDIVLIIMGIAEARAFPSLPLKVTINEYVEISKYYSTPKSSSFVNGLLDKIIKIMMEDGEIVKTSEK